MPSIQTENTHNEEHESKGGPGKRHKIAITAKQQATQHCEDHPGRRHKQTHSLSKFSMIYLKAIHDWKKLSQIISK